MSVVIPCLNAAATLHEQLDALAGQRWDRPWEVVVADNGSTDGTAEVLARYASRLPQLRTVDASQRSGQPFALNVGSMEARGELLAFCDADDVVADGWVAAMGEALERHCLVGGRMEFERLNSSSVSASRPHIQRWGLQHSPAFLPHAGGGNLGIRRTCLEQLGGFDEDLPYLHDTDLCWRAQLAGCGLGFARDALLHVRLRDDLRSTYRQARNYAEYNVILYRRFRQHGMRRWWVWGIGGWGMLVGRLFTVHNKATLARWVWDLGWRVGRLRGSWRQRILAP